MLKNYFKIAARNLVRHKMFSFITIFGLAIGIAACLLIVQFITFELSYDDFHVKGDQIYRLRLDRTRNGVEDQSAGTAPGLGPALKENFPEVIQYARFKNIDYLNSIVAYKDSKFNQENICFVDSTFLSIFNFPIIKGEVKSALSKPYTALVTTSTAKKYFGEEDPIDKVVTLTNQYGEQTYEITGIIDSPENSHLNFDFLLSYESLINLDTQAKDGMGWNAFFTYILLDPKASPAKFETKINAFVGEILAEDMRQYNYKAEFVLQALKEIHLYPLPLRHDQEIKGSETTIYALLIIAAFIIAIAYFNYINLSTSKTAERAREVGIRRVVGSDRNQLIKQFLLESALLNFIAIIIAVAIVQFSIPFFNQLISKELSFSVFDSMQTQLLLLILFFTGSFLAGLYPAFFISSYKPITVLKGKTFSLNKGMGLRKGLVVMQFAASVILIACTVAVFQQISFMRNKELGVDIEQTLVLKGPGILNDNSGSKAESFKSELKQMSSLQSVTTSSIVPGQEITSVNNISKVADEESSFNSYSTHTINIDYGFLNAYDINLVAGRNFSNQFSTDNNSLIISETLSKSLGYESFEAALNQSVKLWGEEYTVVGITEDFHQNSLKSSLLPIAFLLDERGSPYYSIKLNSKGDINDFTEDIATIQAKWNTFFPESPFEYFFLDDHFNMQYKLDLQFGKIFILFTSLAILVASMGLFGLVSFNTSQRIKEIGIRKILGASVPAIVTLLSKDFIKLILLSVLFAWPIIYLSVHKWLDNYSYKIEITGWLFIIPALLVLVIGLATVSVQTIKAALVNPVDSLKNE